MRYLVHVMESTQATYEVEARSEAQAKRKAEAEDHDGRDVWNTDVVAIMGVEKAAR